MELSLFNSDILLLFNHCNMGNFWRFFNYIFLFFINLNNDFWWKCHIFLVVFWNMKILDDYFIAFELCCVYDFENRAQCYLLFFFPYLVHDIRALLHLIYFIRFWLFILNLVCIYLCAKLIEEFIVHSHACII